MPKLIDLHPYDGIERRFRHKDAPGSDGPAVARQVLGLDHEPEHEGLLYSADPSTGAEGV